MGAVEDGAMKIGFFVAAYFVMAFLTFGYNAVAFERECLASVARHSDQWCTGEGSVMPAGFSALVWPVYWTGHGSYLLFKNVSLKIELSE